MSHPQDPRFEGTATYDRDRVISIVSEFYRFLARMPIIEPEDVLFPPPGGWPNINKERFVALGKNDEVVALLANLPYINMSSVDFLVAPFTYPIDYRGERFQLSLEKGEEDLRINGWYIPSFQEFPPWVVPLTTGILHGDYLMLDTSDGTITRYALEMASYPPDYDAADPRHWRDGCIDDTKPVAEYLDHWKDCHQKLDWIGYLRPREPVLYYADEDPSESEELRDIYHTFGWPDAFKRKECRLALIEWEKHRRQNMD